MRWIDSTLKIIKGSVICAIDGKTFEFSSGMEAYIELPKRFDGLERYGIKSISARNDVTIVDVVKKPLDVDRKWIEDYKEKYGVEPNLFDGA